MSDKVLNTLFYFAPVICFVNTKSNLAGPVFLILQTLLRSSRIFIYFMIFGKIKTASCILLLLRFMVKWEVNNRNNYFRHNILFLLAVMGDITYFYYFPTFLSLSYD